MTLTANISCAPMGSTTRFYRLRRRDIVVCDGVDAIGHALVVRMIDGVLSSCSEAPNTCRCEEVSSRAANVLADVIVKRRSTMTKKSLLFGTALIAAATLGYAASHAQVGMMTAANEMEWQELAPNSPLKVVTLWGDSSQGESARLIKFPAGFVAPIHAHTGDYHGINLTGTWRHSFDGGEERELPPGSYVFQPGTAFHGDACVGPEDCILLLHQHVKSDFIPKE